jgi:hypothetical protein
LTLVGKARIAGDHEQPADARERGDNFLHHAVDEIFLPGIAGQVLEWQHCNRRLVGKRQRRNNAWALGPRGFAFDPVGPDRLGDVLHLWVDQFDEADGQFGSDLVVDGSRDTNATWLGQAFEARGDVDAVPQQIVAPNDHVADVHTDAKVHLLGIRFGRVLAGQRLLHRDRAFDGVNRAGKVGHNTVPGSIKDATTMISDQPIHDRPTSG